MLFTFKIYVFTSESCTFVLVHHLFFFNVCNIEFLSLCDVYLWYVLSSSCFFMRDPGRRGAGFVAANEDLTTRITVYCEDTVKRTASLSGWWHLVTVARQMRRSTRDVSLWASWRWAEDVWKPVGLVSGGKTLAVMRSSIRPAVYFSLTHTHLDLFHMNPQVQFTHSCLGGFSGINENTSLLSLFLCLTFYLTGEDFVFLLTPSSPYFCLSKNKSSVWIPPHYRCCSTLSTSI